MSGGGGLSGVDVSNDDDVNMDLFLSHVEVGSKTTTIKRITQKIQVK